MFTGEDESEWTKKGCTFSDKSAREEFELTQDEIIAAIKDGKLQYRTNYIYGNPYFRLIRSEVEALVNEKQGSNYLKNKKIKKELSLINRELRKCKSKIRSLEKRRIELDAQVRRMNMPNLDKPEPKRAEQWQ
ncbi:MAG: hypothetical protein ACMUIP_14145 [bacterium]